ncbi:hypothetical protein [Flavobacterium sp.]|uniref:hypothetical protein n=1 Tax=Flavobacterium sp. TaxID=239 RepID=UPI00286D1047|nr:hypothetical protein [Flavobacterium sp.]
MKKLFLGVLFFAGTTMALAQVEKQDDQQEAIHDKIEQESQPSAQVTQERNTRIEAQRIENEKAAKRAEKKVAKKLAREKAKQRAVSPAPSKK